MKALVCVGCGAQLRKFAKYCGFCVVELGVKA